MITHLSHHTSAPHGRGSRTRRPGAWVAPLALLLTLGLGVVGAVGNGVRPAQALTDDALMDTLQHTAFNYFWFEANPANGLIKDRSTPGSPASIAAVGFGLSAICIGIDHGYITRAQGQARVLTTLNTFWTGPQGTAASGTIGLVGLFYHFLDMNTAVRTWDCELSTIDTALLFAGIIDARQYFNTADATDVQIRTLADNILHRANWNTMRNFTPGIMMGWKPSGGFNGFGQWVGYSEASIMYLIALGSPTFPVPTTSPCSWCTWTSGYDWETHYGYSFVTCPPLFTHQYSFCWVDFRNKWDPYMQARGITYFENSRRATLAQQAYSIANPLGRTGYSATLWGLTASDGPFGYNARGAPPAQNDDGTISPTAPAGSIVFAPEIVLPTLHNMFNNYPSLWGPYGFKDAFHPGLNWYDTDYLGIDQGPIILMIENYRTGKVWQRFMSYPDIQLGLQRAGFVATTGVTDPPVVAPPPFALQNAPNPFEGSTTIRFHLDVAGPVELGLYDVQGRFVRALIDGVRSAGDHSISLDARGLPGGVYFYRLRQGDRQAEHALQIVH